MLLGLSAGGCVPGAGPWAEIVPEQRHFEVRDIDQLPKAHIPLIPPPVTVSNPSPQITPQEMSLDEAIRIALANSKVVRVLAGTTAVSSGQTIYDPAIVNTTIDEARAAFDPVISAQQHLHPERRPGGGFGPDQSAQHASSPATRMDNYELGLGITKKTVTGGTLGLTVNDTVSRFNLESRPGAAEPASPVGRHAQLHAAAASRRRRRGQPRPDRHRPAQYGAVIFSTQGQRCRNWSAA